MKFLISLLLLLSLTAHAGQECTSESSDENIAEGLHITTDVPAHLKGAKITITLANGTTSTVPAERFKVVPRAQQFIVTKTTKNTVFTCTPEQKKNRLSVLGGKGTQEGLDRDDSAAPSQVTVSNKSGAVLGVQYQRETNVKIFDMPLSVGGQIQDNKTGSVLLGVDF